MAGPQIPCLLELLKRSEPSKRDGLAWVLAKSGHFDPSGLLCEADDNLRMWISYIVGYGKHSFDPLTVEAICKADPEVYFAASVLWQITTSWINRLTEY